MAYERALSNVEYDWFHHPTMKTLCLALFFSFKPIIQSPRKPPPPSPNYGPQVKTVPVLHS
jgi:hypothetical protein